MGMKSVPSIKKRYFFFWGIIFLLGLIYFKAQSDFEKYSKCQISIRQLQLQGYMDKLSEKPLRQTLFWSAIHYQWLKEEVEKNKIKIDRAACVPTRIFFHDSDFDKSWGRWLFSSQYESLQAQIDEIQKKGMSISKHIQEDYHNRSVWMAQLYVDLYKVCQLKKSTDRFQRLQSYLSTTCRQPASMALSSCSKEIAKLEKIIQREDQPFRENYNKLESKWPFVTSDLPEITRDCHRLAEWVDLN